MDICGSGERPGETPQKLDISIKPMKLQDINRGKEPLPKIPRLDPESTDIIDPSTELRSHGTNQEKAPPAYVTSSRRSQKYQHPTKNFKLDFAPLPIRATHMVQNIPAVVEPIQPTTVQTIQPAIGKQNVESGGKSSCGKMALNSQTSIDGGAYNVITVPNATGKDNEPASDVKIMSERKGIRTPSPYTSCSCIKPFKRSRWDTLSGQIWGDLCRMCMLKLSQLQELFEERKALERKIVEAREALDQRMVHDKKALEQKWTQCFDTLEQKMFQVMETMEREMFLTMMVAFEQKTVQEIEALCQKTNQCLEDVKQKFRQRLNAFGQKVIQSTQKLDQQMIQEKEKLEQNLNQAKEALEQKIKAQKGELTKIEKLRDSVYSLR